jgi:uncharacterized membrane protein YdfJ with MMPL/SSD domain
VESRCKPPVSHRSSLTVTRFHEELGSDDGDVKGAIERTMSTAGRTIMFSGLTISTSLLGLLIFPIMFLRSIGMGAYQIDLMASLRAILPYALLVIIVAVSVLLFLMTGSLLMPIKAIVLNILSLSATFGALVWIFQEGHLQNLLGFQSLGSIDATQPILIFAIAFGLSMDYEVFLLSRIKERYDATGDNREAVSSGMQRTGRLITSAALLLAVVLLAFGSSKIIFIQEIGIGLAIAVIIDATLVRMLLVPATMRLLGKWNWWAPAPLRAIWRRIGLGESTGSSVSTVSSRDTVMKENIEKQEAQV